MTKSELRQIYLQKRAEFSNETAAEMASSIAARSISYVRDGKLRYISCYLPITKFNEIDTLPLIDSLRQTFDPVMIAVPRADLELGEMTSILLEHDTVIKPNSWGIPEPVDGISISVTALDIIFVPLLCYDKYGNRVGYGKGFYDKYLSGCRDDCKKIGLSYFEPVDSISDVLTTDIKLDVVVTPFDVFEFK